MFQKAIEVGDAYVLRTKVYIVYCINICTTNKGIYCILY